SNAGQALTHDALTAGQHAGGEQSGERGAARDSDAKEATMALSDQLTDLAQRTKHLEDAAAAARARNRAMLEDQQEKLHSQMSAEAQHLESRRARPRRTCGRGGQTRPRTSSSGGRVFEPR